ncbi:MAG TPA: TIGR02996 domain-containing protein [Gemmata sp.]
MNEEAGFLSAIRNAPADDTARLVYADWLDEQPKPAYQTKAQFIRLEQRLLEAPTDEPPEAHDLPSLAATLPNDWLVVVSRPKLDISSQCDPLACAQRWDQLSPTAFSDLRRCRHCKRVVRFCATLIEARSWWSRGERCAAVSPAVERQPGGLGAAPAALQPPGAPWRVVRLPIEMVERLRAASVCGAVRTTALPESTPPAPPVPPVPPALRLPVAPPQARPSTRRSKPKRRRHRHTERENWEEME